MKALDRIKVNIAFWLFTYFLTLILCLFKRENTNVNSIFWAISLIFFIPTIFNIVRLIVFSKKMKTSKVYEGAVINHKRFSRGNSCLTIKMNSREIDTHYIYSSYNSDKYVGRKVKFIIINNVAVITEEMIEVNILNKFKEE